MRKYLSPGDAVIDIGAHVGDTSVLYALAVGPGGKVFAVEPNRYLWPVLEANALLNPQAAPIEIMHFAATEQPTKLVFNYSDPGYCNGGDLDRFGRLAHGHMYPLEVEGRNVLAELRATSPDWLSRIRLIKTDAEGNDHAVLETMRELIVSVRPFILCEVYKRTSIEQRTAFLDFLNELGYDCHRSWPCAELKGQLLNAADMERWPHFDMFCVPR